MTGWMAWNVSLITFPINFNELAEGQRRIEFPVNRQRWGGTINWPEPESVWVTGGIP